MIRPVPSSVSPHHQLTPLARRLVAGHLCITAIFVAINASPLINSWAVSWLFELNTERNLTVWFSSTSLLLIGLIALDLAVQPRSDARSWGLVAAMFTFLSLDEAASIHELVGFLFSERVGTIDALPGLYAWVAVLVPIALVAAIILGRWIMRQAGPGTPARRLGLTALCLWALVPVAEFLDPQLGMPRALVILEESLELVGIGLMLGAFVQMHSRLNSRPPASRTADLEPYEMRAA
jgi:hypothetical protein